ncbi:MAG: DUF805 domain-containing protein [Actinomycetes bacterium]
MNDAVTACFRKYGDFRTRSSRKEYWYFYLCFAGLSLIAALVGNGKSLMASNFIEIVFFVPMISAGVRRLHDTNRTGWFLLIPFYNIYLMAKPGDVGSNRFGEPT